MEKQWYTYLVKCADGSLYCGSTTDVAARVAKHNSGKGAKYTRMRRPVELVWWEHAGSMSDAFKKEYRIKRMARADKIKMAEEHGREEA